VEILKENEEITQEGKGLKLIVPFEVKWLFYFMALDRVIQLFTNVYDSLKSMKDEDGIANKLFSVYQKFETVPIFIMLIDLLEPINILAIKLQKNSLSIEEGNFEYVSCVTN